MEIPSEFFTVAGITIPFYMNIPNMPHLKILQHVHKGPTFNHIYAPSGGGIIIKKIENSNNL